MNFDKKIRVLSQNVYDAEVVNLVLVLGRLAPMQPLEHSVLSSVVIKRLVAYHKFPTFIVDPEMEIIIV